MNIMAQDYYTTKLSLITNCILIDDNIIILCEIRVTQVAQINRVHVVSFRGQRGREGLNQLGECRTLCWHEFPARHHE